jgi:Nucleotidyltransferase
MGVNIEPTTGEANHPGSRRLVRRTCLEIATRLGDFLDEICVVGGLVPSLIVDQSDLHAAREPHLGTVDLDLGFSVGVLDARLYETIADRLREAGFAPDRNSEGAAIAQRWRSAYGITVDLLIPPTRPDDRGGRLRNLENAFAAFIVPGLDLAFRDSEIVTIDDELPSGPRAVRQIRVCGPGAFVVLKALAFGNRAKATDAYDMYYVLRHHRLGAAAIGAVVARFGDDVHCERAIEILHRDFSEAGRIGPASVANFLGGRDEAIQADAAGFVRELLEAAGRVRHGAE